jgi:hypothetical protein
MSTHRGTRLLVVTVTFAAVGLVMAIAPAVLASASGQVCAGIVIDNGTGVAPELQGASVPPGSDDLDLLSAAGDTFTQNDSGLVCAVNEYPANSLENCLNAKHGLYYYWSYWEGDPTTNTWTYADVGPAEHTVAAGQSYVEGWRYQDPGPDSPEATKPSIKPARAFAQACSGGSSAPPQSGGGSSSGAGGSGNAVTTTSAPATLPAASTPATTAVPTPATDSGGTDEDPSTTLPAAGTAAKDPSSTGSQSQSTTTPSTLITEPGTSRIGRPALASAANKGASGDDPALPILLVAALIGMIGVAAWFRWRRRPEEE